MNLAARDDVLGADGVNSRQKRGAENCPFTIVPPCFPRIVSQSQICPSEIAGTVSPCLPGAACAACCEGCLPRQLERFVGGEADLARNPRAEARQPPSRRPPLHQAQVC